MSNKFHKGLKGERMEDQVGLFQYYNVDVLFPNLFSVKF